MFFLITLIVVVLLEWIAWRKTHGTAQKAQFKQRLLANLGLGLVVILITSTEHDYLVRATTWQLWDLSGASFFMQSLCYLLLSTFLGYWMHRAFHTFPVLWRFHGVHHSDDHVSASTSFRHHPGEVLLSIPFFWAAFSVLNLSVEPVLITSFLLGTWSAVVHSDIRVPDGVHRFCWFIPIPALHRIHHERAWHESNHNFAQSFPLWDVLFGTFLPPSRIRRDSVVYGDDALSRLNALELFESAFKPLPAPSAPVRDHPSE